MGEQGLRAQAIFQIGILKSVGVANRQAMLGLEERSLGETKAKLHQGKHGAALPTGPLLALGTSCQASASMILSLQGLLCPL